MVNLRYIPLVTERFKVDHTYHDVASIVRVQLFHYQRCIFFGLLLNIRELVG